MSCSFSIFSVLFNTLYWKFIGHSCEVSDLWFTGTYKNYVCGNCYTVFMKSFGETFQQSSDICYSYCVCQVLVILIVFARSLLFWLCLPGLCYFNCVCKIFVILIVCQNFVILFGFAKSLIILSVSNLCCYFDVFVKFTGGLLSIVLFLILLVEN